MDRAQAIALCRRGRRATVAKLLAMASEILRLRKRVAKLQTLLEEAKRAAKRQAAPFSKGTPKTQPGKPGRKPGRAYGTKAHRPVPDRVDETLDAALPSRCPHCGGPVELCRVAAQYQTDLPPIRPRVTRFNVQVGRCRNCRRRLQGRHPRQTSDALGAAASQLGPNVLALAADMNKGLGLPYDKTRAIVQSHFGIALSRGGLCLALARLARLGRPTYEGLIENVRSSPVVSPDETGWKVGGLLCWLWVFVTPEITVYAILQGRGYPEAAGILGPGYAGTLARDGWAPYRKFTQARHQSCLAHLLRRCHEMIEAAERGAARLPHALRRLLLAALGLRDRHRRGEVSNHGLLVAKGRLQARLDRLLQGRIRHPANRVLLKHLRNEAPHLFTFVGRQDVPATNYMAEQAVRPAVVTRKVWGGNRNWRGAGTQQVLASILRTCRQNGRDPRPSLVRLLRSPRPLRLDLLSRGNSPPA